MATWSRSLLTRMLLLDCVIQQVVTHPPVDIDTYSEWDFSKEGCPPNHEADSAFSRRKDWFKCSDGQEYHCVHKTQGKDVEGCAKAVLCWAGEGPSLTCGTNKECVANCTRCPDTMYNSDKNGIFSHMMIKCPDAKTDCSDEIGRIYASRKVDPTRDADCVCNATHYIPEYDDDYNTNTGVLQSRWSRCIYVGPCNKTLDNKPQERLKHNYTCVPACESGFQRDNATKHCLSPKSSLPSTSIPTTQTTPRSNAEEVTNGDISKIEDQGSSKGKGNLGIGIVIGVVMVIAAIIGFCIGIIWKRRERKRRERKRRQNVIDSSDPVRSHANPDNLVRKLNSAGSDSDSDKGTDDRSAESKIDRPPKPATVDSGHTIINYNINGPRQCNINPTGPNIVVDNPDADSGKNEDASDNGEDRQEETPLMGGKDATCADTNSGSAGESKQTARPRDVPEKFKMDLHEHVLNQCRPLLVKKIDKLRSIRLLDNLLEKEVLLDGVARDMTEQTTTTQRNRMILDAMKSLDWDKYVKFKECLREIGLHNLAQKLEEKEDEIISREMQPAVPGTSGPGTSGTGTSGTGTSGPGTSSDDKVQNRTDEDVKGRLKENEQKMKTVEFDEIPGRANDILLPPPCSNTESTSTASVLRDQKEEMTTEP